MSLVSSFSGAVRSFFYDLHCTRRELAHTALMLKHDARDARSWGFFAIGTLAHKLLNREQDTRDDRESNLRSYAERAVWVTHFLHDPVQIEAIKSGILDGNLDGITTTELDTYLDEHLDELPLHGSGGRRAAMVADVRRQIRQASGFPENAGHLSPSP